MGGCNEKLPLIATSCHSWFGSHCLPRSLRPAPAAAICNLKLQMPQYGRCQWIISLRHRFDDREVMMPRSFKVSHMAR